LRFTAHPDAVARLVQNLLGMGYVVVGPTLREGVVRLDELAEPESLASGVVDIQGPGSYATAGGSPYVFSAVNGPDSAKKYFHPAEVELVKLTEDGQGVKVVSTFRPDRKYAFVGLRPCDLRGLQIFDKTMLVPGLEDPVYSSLRKDSILVVANCTRAGGNCFCASMGTGPEASSGFDAAITELPTKLLIDVPDKNVGLFQGIGLNPATDEDIRLGKKMIEAAREQMVNGIERMNLAESMYAGMESPVWEEAAERCLACGNCTMVCPTCFCNTVQDRIDLRDGSVSRVRTWDSCLAKDFAYSAGGNPRLSRMARYRQFVMHKLAYWPEEFGDYGCVGCGRCVTWCPVGIDIRATVKGVLAGQAGITQEQAGVQIV